MNANQQGAEASGLDRLFGQGKVDIRPQGEINMTAGYQGQNIKNPTLPERARKNGGLDFDMGANLNVIGSIGVKMRMPISSPHPARASSKHVRHPSGCSRVAAKLESPAPDD